MRQHRQGKQDAGPRPPAAEHAGEATERQAHRHEILRVEHGLNGSPDGRKTRQDDQRERFPATTAATRRAEERYGAGHQEEPPDVADVDRRRQRPALDGPLGHGRKSRRTMWAERGRGGERDARSDPGQGGDRAGHKWIAGRGVGVHGTRRKGTREMTVSDGPRRVHGLHRVDCARTAEDENEENEDPGGDAPAQNTCPSGQRLVERCPRGRPDYRLALGQVVHSYPITKIDP